MESSIHENELTQSLLNKNEVPDYLCKHSLSVMLDESNCDSSHHDMPNLILSKSTGCFVPSKPPEICRNSTQSLIHTSEVNGYPEHIEQKKRCCPFFCTIL